jgi:beta-lactamase class A
VTLEDLLLRMITRSSNLATNILIDKTGAKNVNKAMRSIGAKDIQVLRGVEDK